MVLGIITLSLLTRQKSKYEISYFSLPITSSLGKVPPPKRLGRGARPAVRWSVTSRPQPRAHGSGGRWWCLTHEGDSRVHSSRLEAAVRRRESPGSTRYSIACDVAVPSVRAPSRRGRGGDEETRTPDPLLAK